MNIESCELIRIQRIISHSLPLKGNVGKGHEALRQDTTYQLRECGWLYSSILNCLVKFCDGESSAGKGSTLEIATIFPMMVTLSSVCSITRAIGLGRNLKLGMQEPFSKDIFVYVDDHLNRETEITFNIIAYGPKATIRVRVTYIR